MTTITTMWGQHEVTLEWINKDDLPADAVITSAHGMCFQDEDIVLVNVNTRGWDFPGGHMEPGETAEECFHREVMEEACVIGDATLLGYIAVDNRNDELWDASMYPAIGYQAYYRMDVREVFPFAGEFEVEDRIVVSISDLLIKHRSWNPLYQEILDEALQAKELA